MFYYGGSPRVAVDPSAPKVVHRISARYSYRHFQKITHQLVQKKSFNNKKLELRFSGRRGPMHHDNIVQGFCRF